MKISAVQKNNSPSFKGMWNNKAVLKGLETVSEHGTSFIAATTLVMAAGVRPLTIAATPNVKKENKQYAITNSIASGLVKFALVEAVALPIENAIKKVDKSPEKYLKPQTIDTFKKGAETLTKSRDFKFATQFMKLGTGLLTSIPKAMITVALIPVIMGKLFADKKKHEIKEKEKEKDTQTPIYKTYNPVFSPNFKGGITDTAAKGIGKVLDTQIVQNAAARFSSKDADIARNMAIATDLLLTASFVHQTKKSNKIEEERKKPLILNNVYATCASVVGGYAVDSLIKKGTDKFIKNFSEIHKDNPKLPKYIEGINIIRPTLVFAGIYYGILPMITTYLADKSDKQKETKPS